MLNNFCEDKNLTNTILDFHEEIMSAMEIPEWMNIKCPFCKKELPLRSIRSVSLKLNTRNLGDIALEIFCSYCSKMDTLYFRKEAEKLGDFILFLNGRKNPKNDPIIEEEMYKLQYNNLMDKMIGNQNKTETNNDNL